MKYLPIVDMPQSVQKAVRAIWDTIPNRKPLNINEIVYTYGDAVYTNNTPLPKHLQVHEGVHMIQQEKIGGPDIWWKKYGEDPTFRFEQELEAYRAQYQYFKANCKDRNRVFAFASELARQISSPMYGKICEMSPALIGKIIN